MEPRRILIVANQTAAGNHLKEEVARRMQERPCTFKLLVPATPPHSSLWTEGEAIGLATQRMNEALEGLRAIGARIDGEVGDSSPVEAIGDVLRQESFDEVILSTLPPGVSRWLRQDLPHRIERRYGMHVTLIVARREAAEA